jgi:hypothetical protein
MKHSVKHTTAYRAARRVLHQAERLVEHRPWAESMERLYEAELQVRLTGSRGGRLA